MRKLVSSLLLRSFSFQGARGGFFSDLLSAKPFYQFIKYIFPSLLPLSFGEGKQVSKSDCCSSSFLAASSKWRVKRAELLWTEIFSFFPPLLLLSSSSSFYVTYARCVWELRGNTKWIDPRSYYTASLHRVGCTTEWSSYTLYVHILFLNIKRPKKYCPIY